MDSATLAVGALSVIGLFHLFYAQQIYDYWIHHMGAHNESVSRNQMILSIRTFGAFAFILSIALIVLREL
jgi:succinate-acetate transporter protein